MRLALFSRHALAHTTSGISALKVQRPTKRRSLREIIIVSHNSQIEWTDATWNPVRGCTKISPGCKHCYAETFAERFRGVPGHPYEQGFDLRLVPEKLAEPLRVDARRKMVFVNSMSDLFHKDVPDDYIRGRRRRSWRPPTGTPTRS